MNHLDQIDAIKSEARLELIKKTHQRIKGKTKPTFASVMHKLAEREDEPSNIIQHIDFAIDTCMESDLAAENLAEMFG
jgi:hypothetical protein